ncbi:uncharacterized protein N7496_005758 [Penicillium cataractarum]|uniref:FAD-binding domain-containing protein n=1 Tax=Penicillium cataractarum TaxID=2100454 RepID=A0A9W9SJB8_9EURO|nr:uncharacterized protein N7496_005758 [Penicillium cataractarum]KAJ5378349.1 hypothetical protein N7496_005758 [Penicillium cataractarum]
MHAELTRLALDRADQGPEIVMRLGVGVVKTDIVGGTIFFEDGSSFTADLIIGADGEKSVVRQDESWGGNSKLLKSPIREWGNLTWLFADQKESRRKLCEEYKDFHPKIRRALDLLGTSSDWDINFTGPPIQWIKGKAVLIGDAMHSMFPTTGQGACQCLEDAAALGILLSNLRNMEDIPRRLEKFQTLRRERVVEIHALSSVLLGGETKLDEHVRSALPDGRDIEGPLDHLDVTNGYDVIRESNRILLRCFEATGENHRASL